MAIKQNYDLLSVIGKSISKSIKCICYYNLYLFKLNCTELQAMPYGDKTVYRLPQRVLIALDEFAQTNADHLEETLIHVFG